RCRDRVRRHHEPAAGARRRVRFRSGARGRATDPRREGACGAARPRARGDRTRGHACARVDEGGASGGHGAPRLLRRAAAACRGEGRVSTGFPALRAFAAARPDLLDALLARLSRHMAEYLLAQAEAGADAVQIFDSWAGVLSLEDWETLIRPHLTSLLDAVGKAGVPRILFVQNAPHLIDAYASLPAEVLAVDWRVSLSALQRRYAGRAVQGNIDPA